MERRAFFLVRWGVEAPMLPFQWMGESGFLPKMGIGK